jgi:hypothetical protein
LLRLAAFPRLVPVRYNKKSDLRGDYYVSGIKRNCYAERFHSDGMD